MNTYSNQISLAKESYLQNTFLGFGGFVISYTFGWAEFQIVTLFKYVQVLVII